MSLQTNKPQSRLGRVGRKLWHDRVSYAFLLPFAAVFITFTVLPVLASVFYSFTYNNIFEPVRWVGFENYIRLFTRDDVFLTALQNTLVFAVITGPGGYLLSFVVAWLINELSPFLRTLFVLIFYSPTIAGSVYVIFGTLFSGDIYGYVNGALINLGFITDPIEWLTDPQYIKIVIILCVLWGSMGAGFLSFVAGFKNIDKQFYEAAAIDGLRNRWQELWYVTLPMMKPQLLFGAVMQISASFSVSTISQELCGFPSTKYSAHTILLHMQDYGSLRYEMGYACAIAVVLFVLMFVFKKGVSLLMRRIGDE